MYVTDSRVLQRLPLFLPGPLLVVDGTLTTSAFPGSKPLKRQGPDPCWWTTEWMACRTSARKSKDTGWSDSAQQVQNSTNVLASFAISFASPLVLWLSSPQLPFHVRFRNWLSWGSSPLAGLLSPTKESSGQRWPDLPSWWWYAAPLWHQQVLQAVSKMQALLQSFKLDHLTPWDQRAPKGGLVFSTHKFRMRWQKTTYGR